MHASQHMHCSESQALHFIPRGVPITPGAKTSAPLSTASPHCRPTTTLFFCWIRSVRGPREGMTMTSVSSGWGWIGGGGTVLLEYCCKIQCEYMLYTWENKGEQMHIAHWLDVSTINTPHIIGANRSGVKIPGV